MGLSRNDVTARLRLYDEYAPYDWLFPRMAALVHHGGSGKIAVGLRSGFPALVVPFLFDQQFCGQRIADLGAGPCPIPFNKLTSHIITDAIRTMIHDTDMRARFTRMGIKLRNEDGLYAAVNLITQYHVP